jgi:predicted DNA-binding transcriptional regulator AlpA
MKSPVILTKKAAAARASISERHLENLIAAGEGPPLINLGKRRLGIADNDLAAWLRSRRIPQPNSKVA